MIKIKKAIFFVLALITQNIYLMDLSQDDTEQLKLLLHSVSSSVSNSISNAIAQKKNRSFLVKQIQQDLQKQNLTDEQIQMIMDNVNETITRGYYKQILKNYSNAVASGKAENATNVIDQVEALTEKVIDSFIENEIDKISTLKNLKLTDIQKQKIKDDLMEEESDISKDNILDNLKKDKQFSTAFAQNMQPITEQIHIHGHLHVESDISPLAHLPSIKNVSLPISSDIGQLAAQPITPSAGLPSSGVNPDIITPSLLPVEPQPAIRIGDF